MNDILLGIIDGKLTVDEAYDVMDEVVDKSHKGEIEGELHSALGMDIYEFSATAHTLDLGTLAKWRKVGWPTKCGFCKSKVDYKNEGWTITDDKLHCLNCL